MKKITISILSIIFLLSCNTSSPELHINDKITISKSRKLTDNEKNHHKTKFVYTIFDEYNDEILLFTDSTYIVGDTLTFYKK